MKKVTLLFLTLAAFAAQAQKTEKPNLNKALKAYQTGKLDEAKEIVDAATTHEKTKDDGKTWYYRGLVYTALDTTSVDAYKKLADAPLKTAVEAFEKADQLAKPNSEYSITLLTNMVEQTKTQQLERLANYYLDKSIKQLQQGDDYEASIDNGVKSTQVFERAGLKKYNNDTLAYYVLALGAQNAEKYDLTVESLNKYFARGGKSKESYILLYQVYNGPKENKEKALEVVKQGRARYPANSDLAKVELGLLIELNRVGEAKSGLEDAVKRDPSNKLFHFYLGYVNSKLENWDTAKQNFNDALKLDPAYFEAQYYLAQVYYIDASKVKKEISMLGISAADKKKKVDLDKILVEKYKTAMGYMEKAETLKPNDVDVLDKLNDIYYYLGEDAKAARVQQKLKVLGAD